MERIKHYLLLPVFYLIHYIVLIVWRKPVVIGGRVFGLQKVPKPKQNTDLRAHTILTYYLNDGLNKPGKVYIYMDAKFQKRVMRIVLDDGTTKEISYNEDVDNIAPYLHGLDFFVKDAPTN